MSARTKRVDPSPRVDRFQWLDEEVHLLIVGFLTGVHVAPYARVSRRWRSLLDERTLWQDFVKQEHAETPLHPLASHGRIWRDAHTRALSLPPPSVSLSSSPVPSSSSVTSDGAAAESDELQRRREACQWRHYYRQCHAMDCTSSLRWVRLPTKFSHNGMGEMQAHQQVMIDKPSGGKGLLIIGGWNRSRGPTNSLQFLDLTPPSSAAPSSSASSDSRHSGRKHKLDEKTGDDSDSKDIAVPREEKEKKLRETTSTPAATPSVGLDSPAVGPTAIPSSSSSSILSTNERGWHDNLPCTSFNPYDTRRHGGSYRWHYITAHGTLPRPVYGHTCHRINHDTIVMYGGFLAGGYGGETNQLVCLHVPSSTDMDTTNELHHDGDHDDGDSKREGKSAAAIAVASVPLRQPPPPPRARTGGLDDDDEDDDEGHDENANDAPVPDDTERVQPEKPTVPFTWYRPVLRGTIGARAYHAGAYHEGTHSIYVFGGNRDTQPITDLVRIDVHNWDVTRPLCSGEEPPARNSHSCTIVGDYLVVSGGASARRWIPEEGPEMTSVYYLNLLTMHWHRVPDINDKKLDTRPLGRCHAAVPIGHNIMYWGGHKTHSDRTLLLDTRTWTWRSPSQFTTKTVPLARNRHVMTAWGRYVFVSGGKRDGDEITDLHCLDLLASLLPPETAPTTSSSATASSSSSSSSSGNGEIDPEMLQYYMSAAMDDDEEHGRGYGGVRRGIPPWAFFGGGGGGWAVNDDDDDDENNAGGGDNNDQDGEDGEGDGGAQAAAQQQQFIRWLMQRLAAQHRQPPSS